MAKKLQQSDIYEFWKEVKMAKNSKMPMQASIDGISEDANIAELWGTHFWEIFYCQVLSSIYNYRHTALASILSKVLERILLDRLQE